MLPREFEFILDKLKEIPGISSKQATKILNYLFLIKSKGVDIKKEALDFLDTFNKIDECQFCGNLSVGEKCVICSSDKRENILMILENVNQLLKYEEWKIFSGKYLLLSKFIKNNKLDEVKDSEWENFLHYTSNFDEVLIALSPTPEGIITSNYIYDKIRYKLPKIKVSTLAIGIPLGSTVDYMDQLTMSYAIRNRKDIK